MADTGALRAELKAYEKAFKAANGRGPEKQDIKANPEIALKYKLYNAKGRAETVGKTEQTKEILVKPTTEPTPATSASKEVIPDSSYVTPRKARPIVVDLKQVEEELPLQSPSKLRPNRAGFGTPKASPKKGVNPFAISDTPRTNARRWLSGAAQTPPKSNIWRKSSLNTQETEKEDTEMLKPQEREQVFEPSPLKKAGISRPAFEPLFDDEDELPVAPIQPQASTSALVKPPQKQKSTILDFKPVREGSVAFDADRPGKRAVESEHSEGEDDGEFSKKGKKKRKVSEKTEKSKIKQKPKIKGFGKAKGKTSVEEDEEPREPAQILDDGSLLVQVEGANGSVDHVKVSAYKPYGKAMYALVKPPPKLRDANAMEQDPPEEESEGYSDLDDQLEAADANTQEDPDAAEDPHANLPDHLLSLLSLRASPTKKHRQQINERKNLLVRRLLDEPSQRMADRSKSGLADLADEDDGKDDQVQSDNSGDDDWQSESEGWKDVAAGDDLLGLDV